MSTTDTLDAVREAAVNLSPDDQATALHEAESWRDADDRRTYAPRRAFDALTEVLGVFKPYGVTRPEYVAAVLETLDPAAPLPEDPGERVARQLGVNYERRVALLTELGTVQNAPDPAAQATAPADAFVGRLRSLDPDTTAFLADLASTWRGLDRLVPAAQSDEPKGYLLRQIKMIVGDYARSTPREYIRTVYHATTGRPTP